MKSKKRYFILAGLLALLVLTGYLNYVINNNDDSSLASTAPQTSDGAGEEDEGHSASTAASSNFFLEFRTDRENSRAQEVAYLDAIINNKDTDADTLKDAQVQKMAISDAMEKEVTIEGLLKAKGFDEAVVTIHTGSVNVVVDSPELSDAQVAQILDIVQRETGEISENIKVIPKK
ncbi:MAG: SpoIIIAH-like family protein [Christensenellales bacterium]|jgi:stage III sporulation protein AH